MSKLHFVAVLVAIGAVVGCSQLKEDVGTSTTSSRANEPERARAVSEKSITFRELSEVIGAQCGDPTKGSDCTSGNLTAGDYQTVELKPGCDAKGMFGSIAVDEAAVMNRTPPNDTVERARLRKGQKVCVQAIAREGQTDAYYFITPVGCAIPPIGGTEKNCISGWMDAANMTILPM